MKLGHTQHNPKLFNYGFLILLSSIIMPPLFLATQIGFLIDGFMRLVKEYPILHPFFWGVTSIIMVLIFRQFMKDILASFDKTSADAISVFMGLTASAFGYLFFIIFIGSTSAALAALLFSIMVVFIVIGAALKD